MRTSRWSWVKWILSPSLNRKEPHHRDSCRRKSARSARENYSVKVMPATVMCN